MKYALVIIETSSDVTPQVLSSYAQDIEKVDLKKLGVIALNRDVHLCNLDNGLAGLTLLLNEAKIRHIHLRVLFSEKEFPFVHS